MNSTGYDPFARGVFPVGVCTRQLVDTARGLQFPCEIWYPAAAKHAGQDTAPASQDTFATPPDNAARRQSAVRDADAHSGTHPVILFSHSSGGDRRQSTFLCTHLSSHGYVVAALDHSERVNPGLQPKPGETPDQKRARADAWIAARVPDIRFLLACLLDGRADSPAGIDASRIGITGHSFGGWTVLAAIDVEPRFRAVVALAPGGASESKPGILPVRLAFAWGRDVPALYLVAKDDACLPLEGMYELLARTPATKRMAILRRADHMHFVDRVAEMHEVVRTIPADGDFARIQEAMKPVAELCPEEEAHPFVCGLTVAHFDAWLRMSEEARRFWDHHVQAELHGRGIDALVTLAPA